MAVQYLWVQQMVKEKWIVLCKVKGTENPADILTKPKNRTEMAELLMKVGVRLVRSPKRAEAT